MLLAASESAVTKKPRLRLTIRRSSSVRPFGSFQVAMSRDMFTSCGIQWLAQVARYFSHAHLYLNGTSWLTSVCAVDDALVGGLDAARGLRRDARAPRATAVGARGGCERRERWARERRMRRPRGARCLRRERSRWFCLLPRPALRIFPLRSDYRSDDCEAQDISIPALRFCCSVASRSAHSRYSFTHRTHRAYSLTRFALGVVERAELDVAVASSPLAVVCAASPRPLLAHRRTRRCARRSRRR